LATIKPTPTKLDPWRPTESPWVASEQDVRDPNLRACWVCHHRRTGRVWTHRITAQLHCDICHTALPRGRRAQRGTRAWRK
jgi:hypothetical protein